MRRSAASAKSRAGKRCVGETLCGGASSRRNDVQWTAASAKNRVSETPRRRNAVRRNARGETPFRRIVLFPSMHAPCNEKTRLVCALLYVCCEISKRFFNNNVLPSASCLHYLLPNRRDINITVKLRNPSVYCLPTVRTERFKHSFINYAAEHY